MPGVDFNKLNELQEVKSMLAERVVEWTKTWEEQGIEKGIEKGVRQGEAKLLQSLLERRFGPLSEAQQERLQNANEDTLLRWGGRLFQAASVEETLFED